MLTFDFNRKAHTIFPEIYFCTQYFLLHTDIKSTSIWRKIEVHVESSSFWSSYRRFQPLQRNKQHYNAINLGVYSTSRYKLFD